VDVKACPRCGLDHKGQTFYHHTGPHGTEVNPPWYTFCPETADPLALVKDGKDGEKVVKID
jgi:hypothetical protein